MIHLSNKKQKLRALARGPFASESSVGGDGLGELFGDLDHLEGGSVIILQLADYDDHDDGCDGCNDGGDGELEVEFEFLFLLGEVGNVLILVGHCLTFL